MLDQGFIKIYRSMLTWEWYDDVNTKVLFLHLLLTANWEPKQWRGIIIGRGQRVCSRASLANETKLSAQNVRTSLNRLISTGEVTSQSGPQYSIITVKNYDLYQQATGELTNGQPTINQPLTSNQPQLKKDKNENKESIVRFTPPTVQDVSDYCRERGNGIDATHFVDYYESKGWMIGSNRMKNWKAAVRTWEQRTGVNTKPQDGGDWSVDG